MCNIFSLAGERALITGGASGLGLAIARCYIQAGAEVIIVGRDVQTGMFAQQELGSKAHFYSFDITQTKQTTEFIDKVRQEVGQISILINNAGIHCKKSVDTMTDTDFQSVLDTHIMGAFALTRAIVPHMKLARHGNIIFQASMTSFIGQPYVTAYACAKSGYLGMVRTLASELAEFGIRVNGIAPGWIETPMLHKALHGDPARKNKILSRTPLARFGNPQDIGWAAVYLASQAASFVNGIILPVDGGALIGF